MSDALFVVTYEYVDDVLERRAPLREAHLALLRDAHAAGEATMAGAVGDPVTGALFVFRSREAAERFVIADPYGEGGLVVRHRIQPWTLVVGA
ncbi:MAG: hypothetical protein KDC33_08185 [Thermoleophilia bacterium]|nr:hypothetical protein [Thermoleophilia bacterium]